MKIEEAETKISLKKDHLKNFTNTRLDLLLNICPKKPILHLRPLYGLLYIINESLNLNLLTVLPVNR